MNPALIPVGIQLGSTLLGGLFGGKKKTESATPDDLQPMRQQQIGLLNFLLGMGPDPRRVQNPADMQATARAKMPKDPRDFAKWVKSHPDSFAAAQGQAPQNVPGTQTPYAWASQNWQGFADGGMVYGPGDETSDSIPARLSDGEGILTAATVQAIGGPDMVAFLNAIGEKASGQAMPEGGMPMEDGSMGFAGGGVVPPMLPSVPTKQPRPTGVPTNGGEFNLGGAMQPMAPPTQIPANMNPQAPGGTPPVMGSPNGGGVQTPQQRMESFFGPLGITPSGLQNQATNTLGNFLSQPSPEQRAAEITMPQLQNTINGGSPFTQGAMNRLMGMQSGAGADVEGRLGQIGNGPSTGNAMLEMMLQRLGMGGNVQANTANEGVDLLRSIAGGSNPGQGVVNALQPQFQRNLATANQAGGRFGSGNAIMRTRALEDFNTTAANALQRGVDQQSLAASNMGNLILGGNTLGAQTALGNQGHQLNALGMSQQGNQAMGNQVLQALSQLGGFRLAAQGQDAQNATNAGQLGLGQGGLQNSAAQTLAQIFGQQGGADRANAMNAFNAGNVVTGQQNYGQQQTVDLLRQLLGTAQTASLGGPVTQTPSGAQQGAQIGSSLANLWNASQPQPKA